MWRAMKRLFGWDSDADDFDDESYSEPHRPPAASPPRKPAPRPPERPAAAQNDAAPTLSLDDSSLKADAPPPDGGFDPYNTGAFNRSASWEKISKHRDR
jgi:hypothetical protein